MRKVIGRRLFAMMVLMALVTTFMTTPLLTLIGPSEEGTEPTTSSPTWATPSSAEYCVLACVADERIGKSMATLSRALCFRPGERVGAVNLTAPPKRRLFAELKAEQPPSPLEPLLGQAKRASESLAPVAKKQLGFEG